MRKIKNITLCAIDCYNYGAAVVALRNSIKQAEFDRVVLLTDIPVKFDDIEVVRIPTITSTKEYSRFCIKELYKYFDTDYVLLVQHDGWVICGDSWEDEFYEYDFIGAPWLYPDNRNVGNGGVSLRSYKLQLALGTDSFIQISSPEDEIIGRLYRDYLEEKHGIRFPSVELADRFSYELRAPTCKTFAFHGNFHRPYQPVVKIKRTGAMGDVIAVEPVMDWFHKNGYRVCLDTLPQFYNLFQQHQYQILHPSQLDNRVPVRNVNLDLSYESKPHQLHLKTYYEYSGIEDGEIRNPRLNLNFDPKHRDYKLFPKYCVIHNDIRGQPYRNIYGIDWEEVVISLKLKGFIVVQIGKGEHLPIEGAIQFNTSTEALLLMTCSGADLFIGIDSGVSHICSAFNIPSIIFFGSVNPHLIHPSLNNKIIIHNHSGAGVCSRPFCWAVEGGTEGQKCIVDEKKPPCTQYKTIDVLKAINKIT